MNRRRESWIDNIKVIACVLVALGHFVQSMTKSGIIQSTFLTSWFNGTIYFFHVPLFFLCSGFVYQKYSQIESCTEKADLFGNSLFYIFHPYLVAKDCIFRSGEYG